MHSDACDYARRQRLRMLGNCMRVRLPLSSYYVHTLRASVHAANLSFIKLSEHLPGTVTVSYTHLTLPTILRV